MPAFYTHNQSTIPGVDFDDVLGLISEIRNRTGQSRQQAEDDFLHQTSQTLYITYMWVLAAIGIPGNVIVMATIMGMRSLSPATLLTICLSACDCLALVSKFVFWLLYRYDIDKGSGLCKLEFLPHYFSTLANWLLMLISVERFISICFPLRKKDLITNRRCYVIISLVSISLLILFASIFITMRDEDIFSTKCGSVKLYYVFWVREWFWLGVTLYLVLPYFCILGLNVAIIISLFAAGRQRKLLQEHGIGVRVGCATTRPSRTDTMFTAMLVVASIFFLVAALPAGVFYIAYHTRLNVNTKQIKFLQSGNTASKWELFHQISYVLVDSTHALNFFVYFLSAQRFRSLAIDLFCKCTGHRDGNNDQTSTPRVSSPLSPSQNSDKDEEPSNSRDHHINNPPTIETGLLKFPRTNMAPIVSLKEI